MLSCKVWRKEINISYSTDIGTLYLFFALVAGISGTILSLYIRASLVSPSSDFLNQNYHLYNDAPILLVCICCKLLLSDNVVFI